MRDTLPGRMYDRSRLVKTLTLLYAGAIALAIIGGGVMSIGILLGGLSAPVLSGGLTSTPHHAAAVITVLGFIVLMLAKVVGGAAVILTLMGSRVLIKHVIEIQSADESGDSS